MTDDEECSTYCPVAFVEQRHLEPIEGENVQPESWRMKERMKTVSVALVMCLNIGVDPPDVVKPQPCARLECWLDPLALSQQKALETIGAALQKLYERWQARARYKLSLDPTVEDVKKLCTSLRRNAKDERVLFHYNGHGVPKPTKNGEIWVFNRSFTQYIPLSIFDLQTWMGAPSIFVWDCNCAAQIVESFKQFSEQHEREFSTAAEYHRQHSGSGLNQEARLNSSDTLQSSSAHHLQQAAAASAVDDGDETPNAASTTVPNFRDCIQLGACRSDQILPTNPELPADLFTSCLTSPIKVAVLWYILQHNVGDKIPLDIFDKIPGVLTERRTLLGELNWIFTAITDTIAWHVLPRDLFQKLFRQDLLVASLFRNFLLADRVMRSYNCTPVSQPELPPTHEHCMWQAWDFALDVCLSQLLHSTSIVVDLPQQQVVPVPVVLQPAIDVTSTEYTHSPFFAIQLTAFEVWLKYGYNRRDPPLQLPIVLQVLLSQVHRIRALELLGRFLDLGSWAVSLALSVGIFPYVLKLLQSSAKELRPLLSFIWAKILAVDSACQQDLIRDSGHRYFLQILSDPSVSDDQKIVSAFVLSAIVDGYTAGQEAVMQGGFISICLDLLTDCKCSMLRRWLTIGLGRLWSDFDAARWQAIRCLAYEKLYDLLTDPIAEVRAAAVYALGTLISNRSEQNDHATSIYHSIAVILVQYICSDGSPLVRKELLVTLHWLLLNFENQFITLTYELLNEEMVRSDVKFDAKQKPSVDDELRPKNGEIATVPVHAFHHRQSSTTIADNLTTSTLLANKDKTGSAQNLSLLAPPASAAKLSSVASFSKLIGLGGGSQIKQQPQPTTDEYLDAKLRNLRFSSNSLSASGNIYITVWRTISNFLDDPHPEVVELAQTLVDYINKEAKLLYKAKLEAEQQENGLSHSLTLDGAYSVPVPRQHSSLSATDPNSSDVSRPTFVIGSPDYQIPTTAKTSPPNAQHQQQPSKRTRLLTPKLTDDGPKLSVYSTIYPSPRRQVFVPGPSAKDKNAAEPEKSGRKKALIETNFLPWCCRRFTEPILHLFDESGEKFYNHECTLRQPVCDWAVDTKRAMSELCKTEKSSIKTARLDKQIFVNQNNQSPLCLEFFPLHPYFCVGEKRSFSIWNWEVGHLVSSVENHSADRNTEINFVAVINPLKHGFLFTGTTSGEVRVWNCNLSSYFDYSSSFYSPNKPKLLTAWNCRTNDSCRPWYYVPTCYFWEEDSALLLSGDDTKSVRLWDCHTELKVQEIFLSSMDGTVKSIMSDTVGHHMIAVGCSDSTVRLFDRRLPTKECHLMTLRDLQSSATKVYLQPKSVGSHLVSGSEDGQICVWDPRMFRDPVASFRVGEGSRMTSMDVHRSTELIACSTTNHKVYTSNFCGQPRGVIQYYDGFMGQRLADVKCLKFHPYRTNLAVGSIDSMLAMYGLS